MAPCRVRREVRTTPVGVAIGPRVQSGGRATGRRGRPCAAWGRRDDDRSRPSRRAGCSQPSPPAATRSYGVPDLDREELDPRVDGDRQVRERELEPRAPGLRVEQPVAGPAMVAQRGGDPGRRVADDARPAPAGPGRSGRQTGSSAMPTTTNAPATTTFSRRIERRIERARAAVGTWLASRACRRWPRPRASGHQATPRIAYAPIDEEHAEPQRASATASARPRRAMRTTTASDRAEEQETRHVAQRGRLPLGDPLGDQRVDRQADGVGPDQPDRTASGRRPPR